MKPLTYTDYLKNNAILLQQYTSERFKSLLVNIYLKESFYIQKYLEYLSFFTEDVNKFEQSNFTAMAQIYCSKIFDYSKDNQELHQFEKTTETQSNIRMLIDDLFKFHFNAD